MLAEALIELFECLWPLWLVLMLIAGWQLWFRRAQGEGDPASTAARRRRWKIGLIAMALLLALSLILAMLGGRPREGAYQPAQMEIDGSLVPARIQRGDERR